MEPDTTIDQKRNLERLCTDALIQSALEEEDYEAYWDRVVVLHKRGTREVFEAALRLCEDPNPKARGLGVDILGQLGSPERAFPEETLNVLLLQLETESEPEVLNSIGVALGHLHDPRGIGPLARLKVHPDADVRHGVIFGMLGHEDSLAVKTLIDLTMDPDDEVRNWATFGVGRQIDPWVDEKLLMTAEVRSALYERLNDPFPSARAEAFLGLALRQENGIAPALAEELAHIERICPPERVTEDYALGLILEAAMELSHPDLLPSLLRLEEEYLAGDSTLEDAIACTRLRQETAGENYRLLRGDVIFNAPEDGGKYNSVRLGYQGSIRAEGCKDRWATRILWGPAEIVAGDYAEVKLAFQDQDSVTLQSIARDGLRFEILDGDAVVGRGTFYSVPD